MLELSLLGFNLMLQANQHICEPLMGIMLLIGVGELSGFSEGTHDVGKTEYTLKVQ
jgi:hypothetical protein